VVGLDADAGGSAGAVGAWAADPRIVGRTGGAFSVTEAGRSDPSTGKAASGNTGVAESGKVAVEPVVADVARASMAKDGSAGRRVADRRIGAATAEAATADADADAARGEAFRTSAGRGLSGKCDAPAVLVSAGEGAIAGAAEVLTGRAGTTEGGSVRGGVGMDGAAARRSPAAGVGVKSESVIAAMAGVLTAGVGVAAAPQVAEGGSFSAAVGTEIDALLLSGTRAKPVGPTAEVADCAGKAG
jgi:hypothetical protein